MRIKTLLIDVIPTVVIMVWLGSWIYPRLPTIMGDWSPAAAPMAMTDAIEVADTVVFSGESARLRPECSPRRLEWFLGSRNGQNTPVVVNWGPPEKKPNGRFSFHGWVAEIGDADLFRFNTFSDVIHSCRIFGSVDEETGEYTGGWVIPIEVRTKFYH